ncbi:hypothetical protein [Mycobacterium sp. CnD-18-1]|uniref:hypothetical protein n=1 Tax=Mycobacterium sp. CnD-18-1 TaxID=2917744 RepID=UPI001EF37722|nr:hypothetical protein [Mycobacterium sp. CnD-18-1]MCG7610350.1 hypothetical protein [Mycobacterium sp. CnD-18-1]
MSDTDPAVDDQSQNDQGAADQGQADGNNAPDTGQEPAEKDWKAEADKWKALARKHEDQSKANADKAKQFDEITDAQKSELDKARERADQAEARAAEVEQRALRAEVAAAKGIPAALLTGSTQEELEASADALIEFRGKQTPPDFGAGNRGGDTGKVQQMTRSELEQLSKAGKHEEIVKAREEGRLDSLMTSKHR